MLSGHGDSHGLGGSATTCCTTDVVVSESQRRHRRCAGSQGFAAGVPTFHQANYGQGVVYGINLVKTGSTVFRDVLASELGVFDRTDAPRMFRAANDYASRQNRVSAWPRPAS